MGEPPRVPVEEIADVRFDRAGRLAIIVGYAGVHRLDLNTLRARCILSDARADRTATMSADGARAAVFDEYGPCLHVFDLEADTHETVKGASRALRKRMRRVGSRSPGECRGITRSKDRIRLVDADVELRPALGRFKRVLDVARCADGRIAVAASARLDPRAEDPARAVFVFDPRGALLGTVHLALRGRGASLVFFKGKAMTVAALAAAGISVNTRADGEAKGALARFQPAASDGRDEVVFGRSAAGFLGRLDVDAPLGERAYGHEDVARARLALQGRPPIDDVVQACAEDAAERFRYWSAYLDSKKTVAVACDESAGLTPLLPEIAHRLPASGAQRKIQKRLRAVCAELRGLSLPDRRAAHTAMLRRLDAEDRATELAALIGGDAKAIYAAAGGDRAQIERFITAHASGELGLHGCPAPLIEAAMPALERLTRVHCGAGEAGIAALRVLAGGRWPALVTLDASKARLSDDLAVALVKARFPRLQAFHPPASMSPFARTLIRLAPGLEGVDGGATVSLATVFADQRLDDPLRRRLLCVVGARDGEPGLTLRGPALRGVDLAGLLGLLQPEDGPLCLADCAVTVEVARALPAEATLLRCALDVPATVEITRAERRGLPAPALQDCVLEPAAQAAQRIIRGAGALDVAACGALIVNASLPDGRWFALIDRGRGQDRAAFDAAFAALDQGQIDALLDARPGLIAWALQRREMSLCAGVARRCRDAEQADARIGPLMRVQTSQTWAIRPLKRKITLTCEPEPTFAAMGKLFGKQDALTGDKAFDARALLSGPAAVLLERFDAPRRAAWSRALEDGVRLDRAGLSGADTLPPVDDLADLLTTVLEGPPTESVWARLLRRFESEPVGGVRDRLLQVLLAQGDLPADRRATLITQAARDADTAVRARIADEIWRDVEAARDLTRFGGAALAVVLDRLPGERKLTAIKHIGAVGDESCVSALVAAGSGLFKGRDVRDATQAAIAEITKRIGGLRTGGLSVAQADHGGLSTPTEPDEG